MAFTLPILPELDNPLLGFRFGVFFFGQLGISHPLDFRFQSIDGLGASVRLGSETSEGTNTSKRSLPDGTVYENLKLKRGMPLISTYSLEVQKSLNEFRFSPRNVLVSVLDENALPINSWIFSEAFPVRWSLSGLNAESDAVIVEDLELKYRSFKSILL